MTTLAAELEVARQLAREAGALIMDVYRTAFVVTDKGGGDGPVTEADRRANAHIVGALRARFPEDGIVAEESANGDQGWRRPRCWYIDPVDGTREFCNRNGEFAVHIGLAIGGEAKLGVVYRPVDDVLQAGIVGEGATSEGPDGTRALRVSTNVDPAQATLLVSRSNKSKRLAKLVQNAGIGRMHECGSVGVKVGRIASGIADLYVHYGNKSSRWDTCAPEAVVRAAGGDLTDVFGQRYRYDEAEQHNLRGMVGSNGVIWPVVRAAVEALADRV